MGLLVAGTVAELGTPDLDGTQGKIRTPSGYEENLTWHAAQQVWIGRPSVSMRQVENMGMSSSGAPGVWKYPVRGEIPARVAVRPTAFGFFIHKLLGAGELWAAGLRLQEHLSVQMQQITDVAIADSAIALSWYPLDEGDDFLSPESFNHGVQVVLPASTQLDFARPFRWCSSGWQNNVTIEAGTPPLESQHFYPEIYTLGPAANFREFTARRRWVGGPGRGVGGTIEAASKYPPVQDVVQWHRAEHVAAADGAGVAEWADFGGKGQALRQPSAAKRPVVMRDAPGGFRFVRFDGVNDWLETVAAPVPVLQAEPNLPLSPYLWGTPITVYAVLRQRASGAATQVWMANPGGGPALVYRNDNVDEVHVWTGGSDEVYHGADWPTPWMVWSMVLEADHLNVWENLAEVHDGPAQGGTFAGLRIGSNPAENFPAAIDVAELVFASGAHDDAQRTAIVNYLDATYGVL